MCAQPSQGCLFKWSLALSHIHTWMCQRLYRNRWSHKSQVSLVNIRYEPFPYDIVSQLLCHSIFVRWHVEKKDKPMSFQLYPEIQTRLGSFTISKENSFYMFWPWVPDALFNYNTTFLAIEPWNFLLVFLKTKPFFYCLSKENLVPTIEHVFYS